MKTTDPPLSAPGATRPRTGKRLAADCALTGKRLAADGVLTEDRPALARAPTSALAVLDTEPSRLADAWATVLERQSWDWFCTLTFRGNAVHPEAADKRFRVWTSKINRELYGPRWWKHGQGVRWVRALETQRRGVIHYHALLGGAGVDELRRLSWMDEWNELAGFAKIEPPKDAGAVRRYCAKYVVKGGELDLGGPEMHDPTRTPWPTPIVRLRGAQRAGLADVRRLTTGHEYHALMEWARGRARAEPAELLEQVRQRLQKLRGTPSRATQEPQAPRWRSPAVASGASET